jgi:uncharacterized protein (TIGR02001 family)
MLAGLDDYNVPPMSFYRRSVHYAIALAAVVLSLMAGTARCQTSSDLTLVSEYAGRGVALYTRPALQLRVEREIDAGWYGGVFASPVTLDGRTQGQLTVYGGRAQRLTSALSWDAGVTRNTYLRDGEWNYHEFYAGLVLQRASARLFYSPAYYGEGRSAYLDLSGAYPLDDQLRLALHAGLLHPFGNYSASARDSGDVRIALVADVGDFTLQAGRPRAKPACSAGSRPATGTPSKPCTAPIFRA